MKRLTSDNKFLEVITSDRMSARQELDIAGLCREAFEDKKQPNHVNMDPTWENKPNTLLHKLLYNKDDGPFSSKNGAVFLLYEKQDKTLKFRLIGISGMYRMSRNPHWVIGGTRTWLVKEHRFSYSIVKYILPFQFELAKNAGGKVFLLTFNNEMEAFVRLIERCNETIKAGGKSVLYFGEEYPQFYRDVVRYPKKLFIQNVYQHVLVKPIDPVYIPDFSSIEEQDEQLRIPQGFQ